MGIGTIWRPPNSTYTHGYAVMNNTFGITASFQIDGSMDGLSSGSGVFCGTVAGSGSHTKGSGSHTNNSVCSSSEVTAVTSLDEQTELFVCDPLPLV